MDKQRKLLVSRIKTPDGTILTSKHRHDYQSYVDKNGETYILDGGNEYVRTTINAEPAEDVSIYDDSPYEEIRKYVTRGTFDKDGNRKWVPLCELNDPHLKAIIEYNNERGTGDGWYNELINREIEYRKENNISIPECDY